jgi:transmembrane sensor
VSDARDRELPDDVAREVADPSERTALGAVWSALDSARPASAVTPDESAAMWAAIVAGTSVSSSEEGGPVTPVPAAAPLSVTSPSRAGAVAPPARPAWARRPSRRVSAGAALLLVVAVLLGRPGSWQEVQVARGAQRQVLLPDGSTVALDAGSQLRYREGFRGWFGRAAKRGLELRGTAYFAVARDGRPFTVRTYNASVRVLGTEFSVQAWPQDRTGTIVAVAEGQVALAGETAGSVELAAGERATVAHGTATPTAATAVPIDRVAPWRSGGFVAIDEPLAQLLAVLSRRHDVDVVLDSSAVDSFGDQRVTVYYPDAPLDRVLGDLAVMQGLQVERRRTGYVLRLP